MKVFYAGDSAADGPARYLLGILKKNKAKVVHVPPGTSLNLNLLKTNYDLFIFSDFSYKDLPQESEQRIIEQIKKGAGFLMVGGWGSFSGPFGGWRQSQIQAFLPVECLNTDDRKNFPGGALVLPVQESHQILKGISFKNPAAICGVNDIKLRTHSRVLLKAFPVKYAEGEIFLDKKNAVPLLIINSKSALKTACFMTDFAPHWSAGFVDWGTKVERIKIEKGIEIQVGNLYIQLASQILNWLAK